MLLVLDLGVTTGYAVFKPGIPLPHEFGDISFRDLEQTLDKLNGLNSFSLVVAETPVIIRGPLGEKLSWVISQARAVFPSLVEIEAAQWKQTPLGKSEVPRGLSPHVRDAIRMGRWAQKNLVEE